MRFICTAGGSGRLIPGADHEHRRRDWLRAVAAQGVGDERGGEVGEGEQGDAGQVAAEVQKGEAAGENAEDFVEPGGLASLLCKRGTADAGRCNYWTTFVLLRARISAKIRALGWQSARPARSAGRSSARREFGRTTGALNQGSDSHSVNKPWGI